MTKRWGAFRSFNLATTTRRREALARRLTRLGLARAHSGPELEAVGEVGLEWRSEFTGGISDDLVLPHPNARRRAKRFYVFGHEGWLPGWAAAAATCVRFVTHYERERAESRRYISVNSHVRHLTAVFGILLRRAPTLRESLVRAVLEGGPAAGVALLAERGVHLRALDRLNVEHASGCFCRACDSLFRERCVPALKKILRTGEISPRSVPRALAQDESTRGR